MEGWRRGGNMGGCLLKENKAINNCDFMHSIVAIIQLYVERERERWRLFVEGK